MARIGGTKPQLMLRKIMKYLIHDSVLKLYNYAVQSEKKPPFKELQQLNKTILQSIQMQFPMYTEDSYDKYMSGFVKQAKFRQEPKNNGNEVENEEIEVENDDEENKENQNEYGHENEEIEDYDGEDEYNEDEVEEFENEIDD